MIIPDKRLTHNWLAEYLHLTERLEAKEQLHMWTALCVMSASLRRRVWLEMDYGTVFPNLYVIIVAESAKARKSTATDNGYNLLRDALPEMRIMQDSMTSQGLIKALNRPTQVIRDDKIQEELHSDVAIFADEVANLFSYDKVRSSQLVIFLTRTYTCPAVYDHTTVRDSIVRLHNLYPVLLGATDPRNLKVLPPDAVGGLTGRLIWVIEGDRRANNPGWKKDDRAHLEKILLREYLIHDLRRISNLQGEMHAEESAMKMYDNWYEELSKKDSKDPDTDAFYHRCHVTALRVAMLFSVSESDSLIISQKHMAAGITAVEAQLPEMKRATMWHGSSDYEQLRAKFMLFIENSNGAAFRRVLIKHLGVIAETFDKVIDTMVQEGLIEKVAQQIRGDTVYKMVNMPTKKKKSS